MTVDEFAIIVKGLKAVYTDPKFIPDTDAFQVWYGFLKDLDYDTVRAAAERHIASEKFPPVVADLRKIQTEVATRDLLSEVDAWVKVRKATRNGKYGSIEEFEKLPPLVQKAVGGPGMIESWAYLPSDEVETVVKSHFLRAYRAGVERHREEVLLPESVRQLIEATTKRMIQADESRLIGVNEN